MPSLRHAAFLLLASLLPLATAGCAAQEDAQFTARFAPGFSPSKLPVSVFAVYRDGRLSPETWAQIEPAFAAALGQQGCESAFGGHARASSPAFASADEYAKANGVTEDLLDQFADKAKGDYILSLSMSGKPEPPGGEEGLEIPQNPGMTNSRGQAPRPPPIKGGGKGKVRKRSILEIAATIYSVKQHKSMGRMVLKYEGATVEGGLKQFLAQFRDALPPVTCQGWNLPDEG